jgi:hypothetical protein
MDGSRHVLPWLMLAGLLLTCGASCPRRHGLQPPVERVLPPTPTLGQVIDAVNRNNSQIHDFQTTEATLSGQGFPRLRANLAYERPFRLRLRADSVLGQELDLGSNDERFWFWIKRQQPPAVYTCRHGQFAHSPIRQSIPIDPSWLVEALGVAQFDPALPHQGPYPLAGDRLEVRTIRETPAGPSVKATVVDANYGWIVEQRMYDPEGRLIARATAEDHRQDPLSGLFMPTVVEVESPPAQFTMQLDLGRVQINRGFTNPGELWTMPHYEGAPLVDLCNPGFTPPPPGAAATRHPMFARPPRPPRHGARR